jgi:uncharacterized protein YdaU (DUF1376 family)
MSFSYLPLFTGDYIRDTRHLTPMKHGVFLLLLMHCWDQKGPVPLDEQEAAGIVNCRSADEVESLRYVLGKYFVKMEDGWYNRRMQKEVEKSEALSRVRATAGRLGYEARVKHLPSKSYANAMQVHLSPSPSPSPSLSKTTSNPLAQKKPCACEYSPSFLEFWTSYPRKIGKDAAFKAWKGIKPNREILDAMLVAMERQKPTLRWDDGGKFIPHPATWLRAGRWKDETNNAAEANADARLIESIQSDPRFKEVG